MIDSLPEYNRLFLTLTFHSFVFLQDYPASVDSKCMHTKSHEVLCQIFFHFVSFHFISFPLFFFLKAPWRGAYTRNEQVESCTLKSDNERKTQKGTRTAEIT